MKQTFTVEIEWNNENECGCNCWAVKNAIKECIKPDNIKVY